MQVLTLKQATVLRDKRSVAHDVYDDLLDLRDDVQELCKCGDCPVCYIVKQLCDAIQCVERARLVMESSSGS